MPEYSITLNGQPSTIPAGQHVDALIASLELPPQGVAVALNGAVVPRSAWPSTPIPDQSLVDLVTAMQGG